jgi:hypothetical protein
MLAALFGSILTIAAARATWVTADVFTIVETHTSGSPVRIPGRAPSLTAADVGGGPITPAALGCAVVAGLAWMARSGSRRILLVIALLAALVALAVTVAAAVHAASRASARRAFAIPHLQGAPIALTLAGSVIATAGSAVALYGGSAAPVVALPESAPDPAGSEDEGPFEPTPFDA